MESRMIYTAIRRTPKLNNVNLVDKYYPINKGYIYSITDNNGKKYIGSSNKPEKRWAEHCLMVGVCTGATLMG